MTSKLWLLATVAVCAATAQAQYRSVDSAPTKTLFLANLGIAQIAIDRVDDMPELPAMDHESTAVGAALHHFTAGPYVALGIDGASQSHHIFDHKREFGRSIGATVAVGWRVFDSNYIPYASAAVVDVESRDRAPASELPAQTRWSDGDTEVVYNVGLWYDASDAWKLRGELLNIEGRDRIVAGSYYRVRPSGMALGVGLFSTIMADDAAIFGLSFHMGYEHGR